MEGLSPDAKLFAALMALPRAMEAEPSELATDLAGHIRRATALLREAIAELAQARPDPARLARLLTDAEAALAAQADGARRLAARLAA
ncbi:hypothetical protein [Roseococcus sp. YIM B11640]|uniref:hypothetical protein n=1 Tax=Roseococcus sp. YIM B11640 TaxID=3133973 RepID=UPI003C7EA94E